MPFAEDQDMIQALAAKCPDQAFNVRVLPGRPPVPSHLYLQFSLV
jgi:hypothetical protein